MALLAGTETGLPACLEDLVSLLSPRCLDLLGGAALELVRPRLGPFCAQHPVGVDLVLDRVSHWHPFARQWLKTAALDGAYVLNDPFAFQAFEKHAAFSLLARLGLAVPETWLLPPKDQAGLVPGAAERLHRMFALDEVGEALGYPLYLKPYDGGGWDGVSRPEGADQLQRDYDASGARVMNAQAACDDGPLYRCLAVGPQVRVIPFHPAAPLHARYGQGDVPAHLEARLVEATRLANAALGLEINSVEWVVTDQGLHPIDTWNGVPDAAPVHLLGHFPWFLGALLRWLLFCLATARKMRFSTRLARYLQLGREGDTAGMHELADQYFSRPRFEVFCADRLDWFEDELVAYCGSEAFAQRMRAEVEATYPPHEREDFLARLLAHTVSGGPAHPA